MAFDDDHMLNSLERRGQPGASCHRLPEDGCAHMGAEWQLALFYAWLARRLLKPDGLIFHEGGLPITE